MRYLRAALPNLAWAVIAILLYAILPGNRIAYFFEGTTAGTGICMALWEAEKLFHREVAEFIRKNLEEMQENANRKGECFTMGACQNSLDALKIWIKK